MENEGVNKLARVMQKRMQEMCKQPLVLDFGEIQGDFSLITNTFPIPIPKTDYMVARQLTWGAVDTLLTETQTVGEHAHEILIPEKMRSIKAGDRVLVAWVGNDAVVVDIVVPATEVE